MSFVTVPPSPAETPENAELPGDDFWPPIDLIVIREVLRLGTVVTHARLVGAIEGGLLTVEGELAEWRAQRESEGIASLADYEPTRTIGGQHRATLMWLRAVRYAAAAELAELHRGVTATQHGQAEADDQKLTAADYRRLCTQAIRDILGVTRCTVELI